MAFHCIEIMDPAMARAMRRQIITRPNIITRKHMQPPARHAKIIRVVICVTELLIVGIGLLTVAAIDRIQIVNAKRRCQREDATQNGNERAFEDIPRTVGCHRRQKVYKNTITAVNTRTIAH